MKNKVILNTKELSIIIDRLCYELIENHFDFSNTILIGLQPRGVLFANKIFSKLNTITNKKIKYGELDTTFLEMISEERKEC